LFLTGALSIGFVREIFDRVCEGGSTFDGLVSAKACDVISTPYKVGVYHVQAYQHLESSCVQSRQGKLYDPMSRPDSD
jgi:hypothetical protein